MYLSEESLRQQLGNFCIPNFLANILNLVSQFLLPNIIPPWAEVISSNSTFLWRLFSQNFANQKTLNYMGISSNSNVFHYVVIKTKLKKNHKSFNSVFKHVCFRHPASSTSSFTFCYHWTIFHSKTSPHARFRLKLISNKNSYLTPS